MDLNTPEHWSGIYTNWLNEGTIAVRRDEMRETHAVIVGLLPDGGALLDVGCGTGLLLEELAAHRPGIEAFGVDFSPLAVELARAAVPQATVLAADVRHGLPFEDDRFDIAFCGHIVEHLSDPVGLLRDMVRVTKPGGLLIINFPHGDRPYEMHLHDGLDNAAVRAWAEEAGIVDVVELPFIESPAVHNGVIYGRAP